eukprot:TRINITY_DN48988_c0_g1_i1.p1 TRINITY_DN48988_c0_g1~~TRINITY_DN48988_c0_g1_i1.p1  ORF type:complete len:415 (-),score=65.37 TRINITY_DN48988_c0_g1_i1:86-1330(-)
MALPRLPTIVGYKRGTADRRHPNLRGSAVCPSRSSGRRNRAVDLQWAASFGSPSGCTIDNGGAGNNGGAVASPSAQASAEETRPEQARVRSVSQSGRVYNQVYSWRPQVCRSEPKTAPKADIRQEEQLLYMALYGDKIAKHQAKLAAAGDSPRQKIVTETSVGPQPAASRGVIMTSADADVEIPASLDDVPTDVAAVGGLGVGNKTRFQRLTPRSKGPTSGDVSGGNAASDAAVTGARATTHIASVVAHPTHGGVVAEHLETKQLGRLFDQWREQQDVLSGGAEAAPSGGGHRGGGNVGGSARECVGGACIRGAPNSARRDLGLRDRRGLMPASAGTSVEEKLAVESQSEGSDVVDEVEAERLRRLERVFNVITNPTVRVESFADRAAGDSKMRPDVTEIEGFPVIKLMKRHHV